eukprot:scaffold48_cov311-Pinguiococcus_pyrenoidosus.AAC.261
MVAQDARRRLASEDAVVLSRARTQGSRLENLGIRRQRDHPRAVLAVDLGLNISEVVPGVAVREAAANLGRQRVRVGEVIRTGRLIGRRVLHRAEPRLQPWELSALPGTAKDADCDEPQPLHRGL